MSDFQKWLEGTFGRKQLEKFESEKAKENAHTRQGMVEDIRRLEACRDKQLADLTPKVDAAKDRFDAAMKELASANSSYWALRRRRSSLCDSTQRKVAKLQQELAATADPRIEALRREVLRAQENLTPGGSEASTPREWGERKKYFSSGPELEKRVALLVELRQDAEELKTKTPDDLDAALAALRRRLPTEPVRMVEVHP